jgi:hypothetical protein
VSRAFKHPQSLSSQHVPPFPCAPWSQGQQARSSFAATESKGRGTSNACGRQQIGTRQATPPSSINAQSDSPMLPAPQDEPQADVQAAYSYDPPGRNHLFVPGVSARCSNELSRWCSSSRLRWCWGGATIGHSGTTHVLAWLTVVCHCICSLSTPYSGTEIMCESRSQACCRAQALGASLPQDVGVQASAA